MKLQDIIDFDLSYWNVLGQTGGTALPDNDKPVEVNGVQVWKKHPPFRTGKKKKRIDEYQRGPDFDWANDEGAEQFQPGGDYDESEFGGWADSPEGGDAVIISSPSGKRKFTIRKVGKSTEEVVDDEGNRSLRGITGDIGSGEHLGGRRSSGGQLPEGATGTGLGGTGATMHPTSGPNELEHDLGRKHLKKEFKGKDSRADIKTNKDKRESLQQYLKRRSDNA